MSMRLMISPMSMKYLLNSTLAHLETICRDSPSMKYLRKRYPFHCYSGPTLLEQPRQQLTVWAKKYPKTILELSKLSNNWDKDTTFVVMVTKHCPKNKSTSNCTVWAQMYPHTKSEPSKPSYNWNNDAPSATKLTKHCQATKSTSSSLGQEVPIDKFHRFSAKKGR